MPPALLRARGVLYHTQSSHQIRNHGFTDSISEVSFQVQTCSKKFECTVFVSYRVHNKLISTCNIPTKSYIQGKKIQYFLLIFLF